MASNFQTRKTGFYTIMCFSCISSLCNGFLFPTNTTLYWSDKGYLVDADDRGVFEFSLIFEDNNKDAVKFTYNDEEISLEDASKIPNFLLGADDMEGKTIGFDSARLTDELDLGHVRFRFSDHTSVIIDKSGGIVAIRINPNTPTVGNQNWDFKVLMNGVDLKQADKDHYLKLLGEPVSKKRFFRK